MVWCKDGGEVDVEGGGRFECTRWFIGRCVVLSVYVELFVGGGK